jgi:hypothetical protein
MWVVMVTWVVMVLCVMWHGVPSGRRSDRGMVPFRFLLVVPPSRSGR